VTAPRATHLGAEVEALEIRGRRAGEALEAVVAIPGVVGGAAGGDPGDELILGGGIALGIGVALGIGGCTCEALLCLKEVPIKRLGYRSSFLSTFIWNIGARPRRRGSIYRSRPPIT